MNPEAQQIAIAEVCKLHFLHFDVPHGKWLALPLSVKPGEPGSNEMWREFDPLADLNAMHEAEKVLTFAQQVAYALQVGRFTNTTDFGLLHATAAQRAEAFLRTLNLWKD